MTKATVGWTVRLALKIATGILYILTLLAAYGGYFNPEWWTLPAIGVLFFPYFAMATLIVAACWLFCRKLIIGCVGIGVLLACGPTFTSALPFRFPNKASDPEKTFKMVTYNCLHFIDFENPDSIGVTYGVPEPKKRKQYGPENFNRSLHFLIHCDADFICLQELYDFLPEEVPAKYRPQIDSLFRIYPYRSKDPWREVEFLSKIPFRQVEVKLEDDMKYGSCTAYRLNIDGNPLTVVNVHLSSFGLSTGERNIITEAGNQQGLKTSIKEFEGSVYHKMQNAFEERARVSKAVADYAASVKGNVIVCGDFNDVPGSWTYRTFIKKGFEDAYAQTGMGHLITYNQHMMWFHIDQILFKGELVPLYVRKERLGTSDHYPLIAEFEFI